MSKTVDFNVPVRLPDGSVSEKNETVSDVLKGLIASTSVQNVEDTMKIGGWWQSLCSSGKLTLDAADEKKFRETVAESQATVFIKIQVLDVLDEAVKEKKK